ncbi:MAG: hypothetical protein ACR2PL_18020 [Dehalococcoidia bacterium]
MSPHDTSSMKRRDYHSAGHAVAAFLSGIEAGSLTHGSSGSGVLETWRCRFLATDTDIGCDGRSLASADAQALCVAYLGGCVAEALAGVREDGGRAAADLDEVYSLAEEQSGCREELEGLVAGLRLRTHELLADPPAWEAVERLSAVLGKSSSIEAEEIGRVISEVLQDHSRSGRSR